eukprot:UN28317
MHIDISKHHFMDFSTSRDLLIAHFPFNRWFLNKSFLPPCILLDSIIDGKFCSKNKY